MANNSSTAERPAEKQDATPPAQPVARFGSETVSAAVFQQQRTTKKGETFETFNVSLRRSYRKADGSYGNTHTLQERDLPVAIEALQQCLDYIASQPES